MNWRMLELLVLKEVMMEVMINFWLMKFHPSV